MKAIKGHYFPHGMHVPDMKYLSADQPVERLPAPKSVAIALIQSAGKPSVPVVAAGDKVAIGQLIAKADGLISSDVFSSVCGTVIGIKEAPTATGGTETFIYIDNNGNTDTVNLPPLSAPSPEEIKQRIKDAGIVGLGGASFPTYVKVCPKTAVDTLILNGAECEPYLTCDHRIMLERTEEIVRGARYIAKALGVSKIMIGIEPNKPDCIEAFERFDDIQPVILRKQYPMGSEKHLIYVCTKRRVPIGKLPADVGCIVENVATTLAVCEAIESGKPLYERVLTVSGKAISRPKNLLVPLGTDFESIAIACGGSKESLKKIIRGGPMTGAALINNADYTRKATGGILYLDGTETEPYDATPCISCGKCADVCPMRLMPMQTSIYAEAGYFEKAAKYGGVLYCIECGSCAYACPAKRPLLQNIRKTKAEMKKEISVIRGGGK